MQVLSNAAGKQKAYNQHTQKVLWLFKNKFIATILSHPQSEGKGNEKRIGIK